MFQENSNRSKQIFVIVFIAMILREAAWNMVFLFAPLHSSRESNFNLYFFSQILSILFAFIGGWLSDVLGRIRTIFVGVLLGTISSGLMILIPTQPIISITYVLATIGTSIAGIAFWVLMVENSSWKNRGLFIGLTLGGISFFNHQSLDFATTLINRLGKNTTEIFGLITFVVAIVLMTWPEFKSNLLITSLESKTQNLKGRLKPNFATLLFWVLLIQIVSQFGFAAENLEVAFEPGYVQGYAILTRTIIMIIVMALSGWLSDKVGERKILVATLLLACFGGFLPYLIIGTYKSLFSQVLVIALCNMIFSPPLNSFLSKNLPEKNKGLTYGVFNALSSFLFLKLLPINAVIGLEYQKSLPVVILLLLALAFLVWWKLKLPVQSETPVGNVLQD